MSPKKNSVFRLLLDQRENSAKLEMQVRKSESAKLQCPTCPLPLASKRQEGRGGKFD